MTERWLLVEPGRIGDWITSTVAVRRFVEARGCSVDWATRAEVVPLLPAFRQTSRVYVIPERSRPSAFLALLRDLAATRYDGCCVLSPGRSGWWTGQAARASRRIGYLSWPKKAGDASLWSQGLDGDASEYRPRQDHLVVRALVGAGLLGGALRYETLVADESYHPRLSVEGAPLTAAKQSLTTLGLPSDKAVIALQPGTRWPCKEWPPESWRALAVTLARRGRAVLLTAGPGEVDLARGIAQAAGLGVRAFETPVPLLTYAGVLSSCAGVVSTDSGGMHLACALGTPVVGLFGPTSPRLSGPVGPRKRVSIVRTDLALPCQPCSFPSEDTRNKSCAAGELRCQTGLRVESVLRALESLGLL